jgi:hypothetical protein
VSQTPRHHSSSGPCAACPAIGQLWPHRGRKLCDACLTSHEERRARELPEGEERKPLAWAAWESRPITAAEASHRVRSWGVHGVSVSQIINSQIAIHDRKGAPRPSKAVTGAMALPAKKPQFLALGLLDRMGRNK